MSLSEEQKKIIEEVFNWQDKANYSDEDVDILKEMFDTPKKLVVLRKVLGILTAEERGLHYLAPGVNLEGSDEAELGRELIISRQVDERIRQGLSNLYLLLKGKFQEDKKKSLEAENKKAEEKKKRDEEVLEQEKEAKRKFGVNL